jgi:2-amino-4-hydroxy-6-hydroxymethyldihydropteridine diphosphokinase/dihydropteroate synthase
MIYVSIGSNLGNRLLNIINATEALKRKVFNNSQSFPILETKAIKPKGSPAEWDKPFLNTIIRGETSLSPDALLKQLKEIEREMGRPGINEKWSPRIIDLDILFYNDLELETESLVIPHPEVINRPFLLHLLCLIDPYLKLKNKTLGEIVISIPNINESFDRGLTIHPKLVGVVNVTPDSFSDGGKYFETGNAIDHVFGLAKDGAAVIELGAQSTRPGAVIIAPEEEYRRLQPVLDAIAFKMKSGEIRISIDSFYPYVIEKILENYSVSYINDVKGNLNDEILKKIVDKGCRMIAMHSLSVPVKLGEYLNDNEHILHEINNWIKKTLERLIRCGFKKDSVIIDPGIGFGKSSYQSLALIRSAGKIEKLGCEIMFGHSRKSYIAGFSKASSMERDLETIAISDYLSSCDVDYLRVHNVKDHQRFFVSKQLANGNLYG